MEVECSKKEDKARKLSVYSENTLSGYVPFHEEVVWGLPLNKTSFMFPANMKCDTQKKTDPQLFWRKIKCTSGSFYSYSSF